ncbi:plasminogen activator, urokinase a [Triplophysa rosa]|uniref:trypsin n=1 Tax=Triplophysa rosa TaxID=992332 RepID=A0A9W7WNW3_TRIRA|nr:plasminogen activator, urokinase a [Triplophysa rosa]KAI7805591.1 urokinase-type plasminogen activator precursor [Triplophysa rosa]
MKSVFRILLLTCALCFIEATYRWPNNFGKGPGIPTRKQAGECMPDGSDESKYGGKVSVTVNGRICIPWDVLPIRRHLALSLKNCHHNFCRNPDGRFRPWCMVRRGKRLIQESCDIPTSETKTTTSPAPEPLKQDTELTCGERNLPHMSKIVGGLRSSVESQPWMAAIFMGNGFVCGGTLIAPCWVLTAAHCFPSGEETKIWKYSVSLGRNTISETDSKEQKFSVSKLVVHQGFDYRTENYTHDIALLKIVNGDGKCAMKTNSVRTACLPPFQQMVPSGFYCEIAGYGRYQRGGFEYSRHLKMARVELISQSDCQHKYYNEDEVNRYMFCAAGRNWEDDACQGDSGGPLVCEINNTMFLFGIISWGKECAEQSNPGVYTKVTKYNQWIAKHTGLPAYTIGSRFPQKD